MPYLHVHPWTNQRSPFRTLSSHIFPLVPSPLSSGGRVSDAVVSRRCGVAEADDLPKRSCPSDRFLVHRHAHFSASHPIHKPLSDPPPKQKMAALTANVLKGNKLSSRSSGFHAQSVRANATRGFRLVRVSGMKVHAQTQRAEYIWMDGYESSGLKGLMFNEMRSKTKCIPKPIPVGGEFPDWSFDGSSTGQAEGNFSDCILRPVFSCPDPIRGGQDVLVLCEVLDAHGKPHPSNTRFPLTEQLTPEILAEEPLYGFEQEYTMLGADGRPYGWPEGGYPAPQGPFYCGVGPESAYGRALVEAHMDACIKCGLTISGINAEVMPGQWEFQIGPAGPLEMPDHVMVARWLLHRIGEDMGIICTFHPKPMGGDWNGAGAHTNFSTKSMRVEGGMKAIEAAIDKLSKTHMEHITQYGSGNDARLTGLHETCDMNTFKFGVADRGSSIRIPLPVQLAGQGYLEDRRPAANVDPYVVARLLLKSTFS